MTMETPKISLESRLRKHGWYQDEDGDWRCAIGTTPFLNGVLVQELHATSAEQAWIIERDHRESLVFAEPVESKLIWPPRCVPAPLQSAMT